ncbi:protein phosphatase 1 regulatory subunit 37-like [Pollicipes pollicipes]|uniref:protein phosphatase 1 regulatory subunit 37-like n=1 Tax=Pollicipes pollicipes TaxID=41117 RepID=UPI001884B8BA|nr:protein phosphatase 1 regulatory subunit 37-like [Pollicipes pollicipes]
MNCRLEAPPLGPRCVSFPVTPVTALIPATDPLLLLGSSDSVAAYLTACRQHGAAPLPAVLWLSLERTAPDEPAAAALGRSLRTGGLRVLHLERCALHGRPLALLAAGLRHCAALRQLYLADNGLGAADGSLLGGALRHNPALQLLDLRNNQLDDDAAGYLLSGVAEQQPAAPLTGLLALNLWNNRLTAAAAEPLAVLLHRHPTLETLNLGQNALGDEAAPLWSGPLRRGSPLRRLGLQRCRLGAGAAAELGRALAAGAPLRRLDLRGNRLGLDGLRALAAGLRASTSLGQLDLDSDGCSPERADSGIDSPREPGDGGSRTSQDTALSMDSSDAASGDCLDASGLASGGCSLGSADMANSLDSSSLHSSDWSASELVADWTAAGPEVDAEPGPSPSASPLPSPTPGGSRFRVFRVTPAGPPAPTTLPTSTSRAHFAPGTAGRGER